MANDIQQLKELLLNNIEAIEDLLTFFDFHHINRRGDSLRFARSEDGGQNIELRLHNNEWLNVNDYVYNVHKDIFGYISQEKDVPLRDVFQKTKEILKLEDDWSPPKKSKLFGGLYEKIYKSDLHNIKTYPDSVLDCYQPCGNTLWMNDGITLETMRDYDVRFSIQDNAIVFPWHDQYGSIISIKARVNELHPPDDVPKYYYLIKNNISVSLFNYFKCYSELYGAEKVYVFESEKSCMKSFGWGIKNTVAIGSNTLSQEQIKLLMQLQCKEIVLMLDSDLDLNITKRNAELIQQFSCMRNVKISFWDWRDNIDLDSKSSPVDGTKNEFEYILQNEIYDINSLEV